MRRKPAGLGLTGRYQPLCQARSELLTGLVMARHPDQKVLGKTPLFQQLARKLKPVVPQSMYRARVSNILLGQQLLQTVTPFVHQHP